MNPARRQRIAIVRLCAAALLLLGFIAQYHVLSHALASLTAPVPHDPVAGHVHECELCLQLAVAHAALAPATTAIAAAASGRCAVLVAVPSRRAEAFVAYASRAPPPRG